MNDHVVSIIMNGNQQNEEIYVDGVSGDGNNDVDNHTGENGSGDEEMPTKRADDPTADSIRRRRRRRSSSSRRSKNNNNALSSLSLTSSSIVPPTPQHRRSRRQQQRHQQASVSVSVSEGEYSVEYYTEFHNDLEIPTLGGIKIQEADDPDHPDHPDRENYTNKVRQMISDGDIPIQALSLLIGCYFTYTITLYIDCINAVVAQAITLALACSAYPQLSASIGVGVFAGMTSLVQTNYGWLTMYIVITIILWLLVFHKYKFLVGFGGRLGTCAFIGQNITQLIMIGISSLPSSTLNSTWSSSYGSLSSLWSTSILTNEEGNENMIYVGLLFGGITINTVITGLIATTSKIPLNPIQAPTNISLFVMLIFESIYPNSNNDNNYKQIFVEGVAIGAFLSMASIKYLPTVYDFILSGFCCGLWTLFFIPFFNGFGGKLGAMSCLGFCTYILLKKIILSCISYCCCYCNSNSNSNKKHNDDDADDDHESEKEEAGGDNRV
jgi:hypothetical protein